MIKNVLSVLIFTFSCSQVLFGMYEYECNLFKDDFNKDEFFDYIISIKDEEKLKYIENEIKKYILYNFQSKHLAAKYKNRAFALIFAPDKAIGAASPEHKKFSQEITQFMNNLEEKYTLFCEKRNLTIDSDASCDQFRSYMVPALLSDQAREYFFDKQNRITIVKSNYDLDFQDYIDQLQDHYINNLSDKTLIKKFASTVFSKFYSMASIDTKQELDEKKQVYLLNLNISFSNKLNQLYVDLQNIQNQLAINQDDKNIKESKEETESLIKKFQNTKNIFEKMINETCKSFNHYNYEIDVLTIIEELKEETFKQISYIKNKQFDEIKKKEYLPVYVNLFCKVFANFNLEEKIELLESLYEIEEKSRSLKKAIYVIESIIPYDEDKGDFNVYFNFETFIQNQQNEYLALANELRALNKIKTDNFINKEFIKIRQQQLEDNEIKISDKFSTLMNPFDGNSVYREGLSDAFWNDFMSLETLADIFIPLVASSKIGGKSIIESNKGIEFILKKTGKMPSLSQNNGQSLEQLTNKVIDKKSVNNKLFLTKAIYEKSRDANQKTRLHKQIRHLESRP